MNFIDFLVEQYKEYITEEAKAVCQSIISVFGEPAAGNMSENLENVEMAWCNEEFDKMLEVWVDKEGFVEYTGTIFGEKTETVIGFYMTHDAQSWIDK